MKIVKFEDVKNQSTEDYFNDNQFSIDAFNKKYKLFSHETYVQAIKRVCDEIASVEKDSKAQKYWAERWFDEIYNDWWHPAGSIMQGAGNSKSVSLSNCTHVTLGNVDENNEWDNLESIIRNCAYGVAKTAAYRQGLGVDFSRLRPRGSEVNNSANESTGAIHWMEFIDKIAYYVGQKGRIPAFLFSISINHPDVEEFIQVKSDYTKIQNANISVQVTDEFYKAVENDKDWTLTFSIPAQKKGQKVYVDKNTALPEYEKDEIGYYYIARKDRKKETFEKTVKAKYLLELIAKNMYANAEPGIQNMDIAKKYSNSDYVYDPNDPLDSKIAGSNACSEQMLNRDGLCILSSINCEKFSVDNEQYEKELSEIGPSINRFLDNVVEYEIRNKKYATDFQRLSLQKLRRTGAGYTNIAGLLFKAGYEYGTKEGNEFIENFTKAYNYYLYVSSIELGREKGSFELFDKEKFEKSPFVKRMKELGLEFDAMRNVTCSSIAPTGSLSLMFRGCVMSYGIEPAFGMYYWKRTRISGSYKYYFNVPKIVRDVYKNAGYEIPIKSDTVEDTWDGQIGIPVVEFIEKNKDKVGVVFKEATEVSAFDKLDLMGRVAKWIDSSISVTYMLPENTNWKDVYNFILEAWKKEVKSVAAFPDRKMYGIVSYIPFKELAFKLKHEGISIHAQNFNSQELKEFGGSEEQIEIKTDTAPKRPKELAADIYIVTAKGEKYIIAIGKLNNVPYEIFGGKSNGFNLKKSSSGVLIKHKRGQYGLTMGDVEFDDFSKHFTPEEQTLFRTLSTTLRHGVPIEFIVEQMQKSTDDMFSLPSAVARVLKKYIKDGQKVNGQSCLSCGSKELVYLDGCVSCSNCGWSKCS